MPAQFKHQGSEKKKYVKQMFNDISSQYDTFNLLSSFGIDRYWRYNLIKKLKLSSNNALLDIATGTGDVAFSAYKKYNVEVTGLDIADNMIALAQKKSYKYNTNKINFLVGDAENLPFSNNSFDAITISFGFRNLGAYDVALSEFYRVLKPGGRLAILEFSQSNSRWFSPIFKFYFNKVVPKIGAFLSRKDAFLYLPESVDYFLKRDDLVKLMKQSEFDDVSFYDYTFGVATIYMGYKIV